MVEENFSSDGHPAFSRGLDLNDLYGPFQPKLLYGSIMMILHQNFSSFSFPLELNSVNSFSLSHILVI